MRARHRNLLDLLMHLLSIAHVHTRLIRLAVLAVVVGSVAWYARARTARTTHTDVAGVAPRIHAPAPTRHVRGDVAALGVVEAEVCGGGGGGADVEVTHGARVVVWVSYAELEGVGYVYRVVDLGGDPGF